MRFLTVLLLFLFSAPALATPPNECVDDNDCKRLCTEQLKQWTSPKTTLTTYVSSKCEKFGKATSDGTNGTSSIGCSCNLSSNASHVLAKNWAKDGCLVYGRSHRCLYKESDFPGCQQDKPDSCKSVCDELQKRIQEDEKKSFKASVQDGHCDRACHCLFKIEGKCFLNTSTDRHKEQDCSKTAAQIVKENTPVTQPAWGCQSLQNNPHSNHLWLVCLGLICLGWKRRESKSN